MGGMVWLIYIGRKGGVLVSDNCGVCRCCCCGCCRCGRCCCGRGVCFLGEPFAVYEFGDGGRVFCGDGGPVSRREKDGGSSSFRQVIENMKH